jgi:hypothetical protein
MAETVRRQVNASTASTTTPRATRYGHEEDDGAAGHEAQQPGDRGVADEERHDGPDDDRHGSTPSSADGSCVMPAP